MDVSVIMINYNTLSLTRDAIDSIFAHTRDLAYEIILVDNASPDGSGEELNGIYGDKIRYIQSGGNLGTSKAFNLGLRASSGKYVLWMNTDILVKDNFIKKLFDFMEEHPSCGICGGNILDFEGNPAHSFRRRLPTAKSIKRDMSVFVKAFRLLFKKMLCDEYNYTDKPMEVGYITGADMMARRELFPAVGPFNEKIFMYAEETEFTYRVVSRTDYKVFCVPDAHMYHLEGASFNGKKAFSERRCRSVIFGTSVYINESYGSGELKKYLKIMASASRRLSFIYRLMGLKEKSKTQAANARIAKEYLSGFEQYLSTLQG